MRLKGMIPLTYIENTGGAQNNPFRIKLRAKDKRIAAVYGQELYEWKFRFWLFFPFVLPLLLIAFGPLLRYTELRGHAITVALSESLYGIDYEEALQYNADNLARFYSGFDDKEKVKAEMRALKPWALKWAAARMTKIERILNWQANNQM